MFKSNFLKGTNNLKIYIHIFTIVNSLDILISYCLESAFYDNKAWSLTMHASVTMLLHSLDYNISRVSQSPNCIFLFFRSLVTRAAKRELRWRRLMPQFNLLYTYNASLKKMYNSKDATQFSFIFMVPLWLSVHLPNWDAIKTSKTHD